MILAFRRRQRGASMIEILIITPVLILISTAIVQIALLYHFKQGVIHGGLQASRAASVNNGGFDAQRLALAKSMVPWFGGGHTMAELQSSLARSMLDVSSYTQLEVLNPTSADFDHFKDPLLSANLGLNAISQSDLWRNASQAPDGADKNKLEALRYRVRLQYAAPANVPVAGKLIVFLMSSIDSAGSSSGASSNNPGPSEDFRAWALGRGRIPLTTEYETIMQSDLYEPDVFISAPPTPTLVAFAPASPDQCVGATCPGDWDGGGSADAPIGGASGNPVFTIDGPLDGPDTGSVDGSNDKPADDPVEGCRHPFCMPEKPEVCSN